MRRIDQISSTSVAAVERGLGARLGMETNEDGFHISKLITVDGRYVPIFFERPITEMLQDRKFPAINISFLGHQNSLDRMESYDGGIELGYEGGERIVVPDSNLNAYDLLFRVQSFSRRMIDKRELDDQLLAAFPIKGNIFIDGQYWLCFPQNRNSANHYMYDQGTYRTPFDIIIPIVTLSKFGSRKVPVAQQFDITFDADS